MSADGGGETAGTGVAGGTPAEDPNYAWVRPRLDALTRQKSDAERRAEAAEATAAQLKAQLEQARASGAAVPPAAPAPVPSEGQGRRTYSEEEVRLYAAQVAADQAHTKSLDRMALDGEHAHSDFKERVTDMITRIGPIPRAALEALSELPDGPEIIYDLTQNLGKAQDIFLSSPTKMVTSLVKLSKTDKPSPTAKTTKAPAPVKEVVSGEGKGDADFDSPDLDMETWQALRNKQVKAKKEVGGG